MIELIKCTGYNAWDTEYIINDDESAVSNDEIARVNQLLNLFDRYVKHIVRQEGTNYTFYGDFTEAECAIIDSIHKGHLDD